MYYPPTAALIPRIEPGADYSQYPLINNDEDHSRQDEIPCLHHKPLKLHMNPKYYNYSVVGVRDQVQAKCFVQLSFALKCSV
ncbi:hypothetical protein DAKH74_029090 [Maudiozyma humilis]|uniref:Uncharacterized protein n=1 Tax=Maudiozyma humilis TaxID=51915 RepID=A0AAV5S0A2_MAUHU|nr:hypothetical protein DAKH74_029090 [Kazachstania humilis]